jgi:pimeloyl-ACP methyl ester carboxylesterase
MRTPDEQVVVTSDGRRVGVAVHGSPDGKPVLLFHGTPASRLGHEFTDAPASERGVRVICPDRPGMGLSDPRPLRAVADYAEDVAALADALHLDRFAVIGYSGGGPYALAVGAGLPQRVTAVALVAGSWPMDHPGAWEGVDGIELRLAQLAEHRPWAARLMLRALAVGAKRSPKAALGKLKREVSEVDRRVLDQAGPDFVRFFVEAFRQGTQGVVDDYRLWVTPWGFPLEDVRAPVHIWQGDDDRMAPMRHAEELAARLPRATLHRLHGAGHFSITSHFGEILDSLTR